MQAVPHRHPVGRFDILRLERGGRLRRVHKEVPGGELRLFPKKTYIFPTKICVFMFVFFKKLNLSQK